MFRNRKRLSIGGGKSMVRSNFRAECDINTIVARYANGAQLPPTADDLVFGDVSEIGDYKTCLDIVKSIGSRIRELPEKAAALFNSDPGRFISSIEAAKDREALVNLGLVEALPPPVEPVVPPVKAE